MRALTVLLLINVAGYCATLAAFSGANIIRRDTALMTLDVVLDACYAGVNGFLLLANGVESAGTVQLLALLFPVVMLVMRSLEMQKGAPEARLRTSTTPAHPLFTRSETVRPSQQAGRRAKSAPRQREVRSRQQL